MNLCCLIPAVFLSLLQFVISDFPNTRKISSHKTSLWESSTRGLSNDQNGIPTSVLWDRVSVYIFPPHYLQLHSTNQCSTVGSGSMPNVRDNLVLTCLYWLNWLAWELPNYGPSPGFYRSKIYTRGHDDEYQDGVLDSNDSNLPEEVTTDHSAQRRVLPAASRSIPSIAPVFTRSQLTRTGSSDTCGRTQIAPQQARPTSTSLQHQARPSTTALRQTDTPSKARWRNGFRPDGKCTQVLILS